MKYKPPILNKEFKFKTSRSGGKGGQNVNKLSTKVQLEFNILDSEIISESDKEIILIKISNKLINGSTIQIISQTERSQLSNKIIAKTKLYFIIDKSLQTQKTRKKTTPNKASIQARITSKKKNQIKKQRRNKNFLDS